MPGCKLWFLDGKNSEGKVVSNPDIGYGSRDHKYADGTIREFYQIGLSANKTGISVYILGIEDKKYLSVTYAKDLGKASVTGYCIRFKTLKDINIDVLEAAIRYRSRLTTATKPGVLQIENEVHVAGHSFLNIGSRAIFL